MKIAFKILEPLMSKGEEFLKRTVVMETVKRDIYEISKNVYYTMLCEAGITSSTWDTTSPFRTPLMPVMRMRSRCSEDPL